MTFGSNQQSSPTVGSHGKDSSQRQSGRVLSDAFSPALGVPFVGNHSRARRGVAFWQPNLTPNAPDYGYVFAFGGEGLTPLQGRLRERFLEILPFP